ncbi:MAG TPA: response regulator transcription factor [Candidatus Dormibacteraeota bacterium]|jgi:DNA-binding NarL/FixJ family response regulator|nr:response regulator transcription factor [Candidatus Dormibacteraeota bacterium]
MAIRVFLADDNALFRDGVAQLLQSDGRFEVVGQASTGEEAVAAVSQHRPDLILMDLRMPGMSGVEAIKRIRAQNPELPIGVLTMFESPDYVQQALNAGANGYVAKDATPADLSDAAIALAQGKRQLVVPSYTDADEAAPKSSQLLSRLTPREVDVLRALCTRSSNEVIARNLGISPKTLRNHISNVYHKLDIHDRAQAVIVAVREDLVGVDARN